MIASLLSVLWLQAAEAPTDPVGAIIETLAPETPAIRCAGPHRQGAMVVCRTAPGATVSSIRIYRRWSSGISSSSSLPG